MIGLIKCLNIFLAGVTTLTAGATKLEAAETKDRFIDDIRTVYANTEEEAKAQLPEGYELSTAGYIHNNAENTRSGNSDYEKTWLAIKRTDDVSNAVTSIKAMNMNGGWSCAAYEQVLNDQEHSANKIAKQIMPAITDFRTKYKNNKGLTDEGLDTGTSYAALILDCYYNEDVVDSNGNPYTLLDIFVNDGLLTDAELEDVVTRMYMQASGKVLKSVNTALMYSATANNDITQKSYLQKINDYWSEEESEEDLIIDAFPSITYEEVNQMVTCISSIKDVLTPFANSEFAEHPENFDADDINTYKSSLDTNAAAEFETSSLIYGQLADTQFLGESLVDFFLNVDTEDEEFNTARAIPFLLYLNDAQKAVVPYCGLENLFLSSIYENSRYTEEDGGQELPRYGLLKKLLKLNVDQAESKISIFTGIDRRIYNAEGIALTSDAIRQNNAKNDFNWFEETNETVALLDKILVITAIAGGALFATAGIAYLGLKVLSYFNYKAVYSYLFQGTFARSVEFWASRYTPEIAAKLAAEATGEAAAQSVVMETAESTTAKSIQLITTEGLFDETAIIGAMHNMMYLIYAIQAVMAIAMVCFAIAAIVAIIKEIVRISTEHIDYLDIPEMIVDEKLVNDEATYTFYQNCKTFTDINDPSKGEPADITRASLEGRKYSQWVALYYTKDADAGSPILADSLATYNSFSSCKNKSGVSKFGTNGLYNVLGYFSKDISHTIIGVRYITYECVNALEVAKEDALAKLKAYATELLDGKTLYGEMKSIYSEYTYAIKHAETVADVKAKLIEGQDALNTAFVNYSDADALAASMFGEGSLGLLFVGLIGGLLLGAGGLYLTLTLIKKNKKKEEEAK